MSMVTVSGSVLDQYEAFTCYNSPYIAHDNASAIDLYPGGDFAPSPVTGEVVDILTVKAPPKPYADDLDHVIVIDTAVTGDGHEHDGIEGSPVARILHVDPMVEVGDQVRVGDNLGRLVRAGFFAPWVDNHLHLGFRRPDADPRRAKGSIPLYLDVSVTPLRWEGAGFVRATGETYAMLDAPVDSAVVPDDRDWVSLASDGGSVIDGGLPHYDHGGMLDRITRDRGRGFAQEGAIVRLLGTEIGVIGERWIDWDRISILANDRPITGLSLFCSRWDDFGIKLICPKQDFNVGEEMSVKIVNECLDST